MTLRNTSSSSVGAGAWLSHGDDASGRAGVGWLVMGALAALMTLHESHCRFARRSAISSNNSRIFRFSSMLFASAYLARSFDAMN